MRWVALDEGDTPSYLAEEHLNPEISSGGTSEHLQREFGILPGTCPVPQPHGLVLSETRWFTAAVVWGSQLITYIRIGRVSCVVLSVWEPTLSTVCKLYQIFLFIMNSSVKMTSISEINLCILKHTFNF